MKITKQKIYLGTAGLVLILVGAFISFLPLTYLGQFEIDKLASIEILSELRGMGGNLLVFGIFVLIGAFYKAFEEVALIVAALTFSSFVVFRIIGVFIDGMPQQAIVYALITEFVLGAFAILLLFKNKGITHIDLQTEV